MRSSHAGRGCPWGGGCHIHVAPYELGHQHAPLALVRGVPVKGASRLPSATASHPTRSPSQLSSSWRSAAARSVGSMRSKGP